MVILLKSASRTAFETQHWTAESLYHGLEMVLRLEWAGALSSEVRDWDAVVQKSRLVARCWRCLHLRKPNSFVVSSGHFELSQRMPRPKKVGYGS